MNEGRKKSTAVNYGLRLKVYHLSFLAFSTEEEAVLESILRDRSHIEDTLRLAADEKAGDYAGRRNKACVIDGYTHGHPHIKFSEHHP